MPILLRRRRLSPGQGSPRSEGAVACSHSRRGDTVSPRGHQAEAKKQLRSTGPGKPADRQPSTSPRRRIVSIHPKQNEYMDTYRKLPQLTQPYFEPSGDNASIVIADHEPSAMRSKVP